MKPETILIAATATPTTPPCPSLRWAPPPWWTASAPAPAPVSPSGTSLPIHIHRALLGGVGMDAVAAAVGMSPGEVSRMWQRWADRQVDRWRTSNPHRRIGVDPANRDRVQAVLGHRENGDGGDV